MTEESADVVVIGAGLSGLSAARQIQRDGRSVIVLEARERVGGRTLSRALGDDVIDLGGQWVGHDHHRVRELVADLGLRLFPQHNVGRKILRFRGRQKTYAGTIPSLPVWSLIELELTIRRLDHKASRLDAASPWSHSRAHEYDSMTVQTWLRDHVRSAGARFALTTVVKAIFVCEPRELSFLYFLSYVRAAGGLMALVEVEEGAQQDRIHGGAQQLSIQLAGELEVRTSQPVRSVEWSADTVTVRTDDAVYSAARCIVAIAPALVARVAFEPALPARRDALMQRMPMGTVIKCVAAYEEPFWREDGYAGEAVCDDGPVRFMFDDSAADGCQGALVGFIAGDEARSWSTATDGARRQAVLQHWASLFGDRAARPVAYVDHDWNAERWSRGCYVGVMGPGTLTSIGDELRRPVGAIHWAGTETATEWTGYFEGALQAGARAATEVLDRV